MSTSAGSQLTRARAERKLSLADVTKETKIQPWVLEALEADRLLEHMSPVYVKGFLTTYAKFLHLEPEPLIAELLPPPPAEPVVPQPLPPPHNLPSTIHLRLPVVFRRRVGVIGAISAAVMGLLVIHPLRWRSRETLPHLNMPKQLASLTQAAQPSKPPSLRAIALLPTQPLELSITARRTTWIQLKADGKLLAQQRIQRGVNERWIAKKQFELVVAKPSQVDLTLNGQSISPFAMAHQGRLLITHRGVTRLLPDEE